MTDEQVRRYARHILLPEIGGRGQTRLLASRCAVAIGPCRDAEACALLYLAAAGVGTIVVAGELDAPVTAGEQAAQPIYVASDVGRPRGVAIRDRIAAINPDVAIASNGAAGDDTPAIDVPAAAWLDGPPVAVAFARGGAAAAQLIGRLLA